MPPERRDKSHPIVRAVLSDPVVKAAVSEAAPIPPIKSTSGQMVASPTTTEEEERITFGQRRINLIWEITQAVVAILVTSATLYVSAQLALADKEATAAFLLLSNAFFAVIIAYIQRTNHTKIGGVGKNDGGR